MSLENQKPSKAIKVVSWIAIVFVIVGETFKVMHWPGAALFLLLASFVFSCFYLPLYTFESWKSQTTNRSKAILLFQTLILFLFAIGFIIKIQHWPGAGPIAILNYVILGIFVIPFAIYQFKKASNLNLLKFHSILLVIYFFALTFGSLTNASTGKIKIDSVLMQGQNVEIALKSATTRNIQLYNSILNTESNQQSQVIEKINRLKFNTDEALKHIKKLQLFLTTTIEEIPKSEADTISSIQIKKSNNSDLPTEIMIGNRLKLNTDQYSAQKLKSVINNYKDSILLLVQENNKTIIKEGLNLNTDNYESEDGEPISWELANFNQMPFLYVFNSLTSIMYEIKNAEYQVLTDIINSDNKELNSALSSQIADLNAKFDAIKKQEQISKLESENEKRLRLLNDKNTELSDRGQVIIYFTLATLLFIVLLFFIIRSNYLRKQTNQKLFEQKLLIEKQKAEVEDKNNEILDSIEYAKRIQNTILPAQKIVSQYLENSFILYLPKDIVAGDFYWMNSPKLEENKKGEAILFAACDCTGHGVPGAMVSVVCSNALNKAVKEFGLTQPAKILDKVAELVIEDLSKNNDVGDEIQDGMDASLCSLNLKTGELQWAGANNSLYIIKSAKGKVKSENNFELETLNFELEEVKADKQPIGKFDNPKPFTNHSIQLQKGDSIYLFTDGYADQFGGPKAKKYSKGKFKDLLLSIQHLPMNEQHEKLYNAHIEWRSTQEQVDDICVIGVRV